MSLSQFTYLVSVLLDTTITAPVLLYLSYSALSTLSQIEILFGLPGALFMSSFPRSMPRFLALHVRIVSTSRLTRIFREMVLKYGDEKSVLLDAVNCVAQWLKCGPAH